MTQLNSVCDAHGHDPGLPDRDLRAQVLVAATRATEGVQAAHGYADLERSVKILHVACEDARGPSAGYVSSYLPRHSNRRSSHPGGRAVSHASP